MIRKRGTMPNANLPDVLSSIKQSHHAFWLGESVETELEPGERLSNKPLTQIVTDDFPLYAKIVKAVNRELKFAGYSGSVSSAKFDIAKQILDAATAEIFEKLP